MPVFNSAASSVLKMFLKVDPINKKVVNRKSYWNQCSKQWESQVASCSTSDFCFCRGSKGYKRKNYLPSSARRLKVCDVDLADHMQPGAQTAIPWMKAHNPLLCFQFTLARMFWVFFLFATMFDWYRYAKWNSTPYKKEGGGIKRDTYILHGAVFHIISATAAGKLPRFECFGRKQNIKRRREEETRRMSLTNVFFKTC